MAIAVFVGAVLKLKRSKLDSIEAGLAAMAEAVFVAATVCSELCVVLTSFSLEQGNLLMGIDNKTVKTLGDFNLFADFLFPKIQQTMIAVTKIVICNIGKLKVYYCFK